MYTELRTDILQRLLIFFSRTPGFAYTVVFSIFFAIYLSLSFDPRYLYYYSIIAGAGFLSGLYADKNAVNQTVTAMKISGATYMSLRWILLIVFLVRAILSITIVFLWTVWRFRSADAAALTATIFLSLVFSAVLFVEYSLRWWQA